MKQLAIITCTCAALASPALAEDEKSLMEQGIEMFLRGLATEMEPAIEDLRDLSRDLGPALQDFQGELGMIAAELLRRVDDLGHYGRPEVLPNGDILIPRKPDAPDYVAPPKDSPDAIDL